MSDLQPPRSGKIGANEWSVLNVPRARVTRNAALTANAGAGLGIVTWDALLYDTDGLWSSASPTVLTARTTGLYSCRFSLYFGPGSTNTSFREIYMIHLTTNVLYGYEVVCPVQQPGGIGTAIVINDHVPLNAGEQLQCRYSQSDASNIAMNVGSQYMNFGAVLVSTI